MSRGSPSCVSGLPPYTQVPAPKNVLVTVGAIEANFIVASTLTGPGDRMATMLPNYLQVWGAALNRGADVAGFAMATDRGWALDTDALEAAVTPGTRLVAVCHPNNPTGHALTETEMDTVIAAAERAGAWLLADEVYRGAERATDVETPTFWGRSDRVIAVGSMSKAYGLPGLRIGWAVGPTEVIGELWRRHEYVTISAGKLDMHLAAMALSPQVRPQLLTRTRGYIRRGYPIVDEWMSNHPGIFAITPPDAAAIAFPRYSLAIGSTDLADRIRSGTSVLVVPGDHFGVDGHLRISYGLPEAYLRDGLDRVASVIGALA